MTISDIIKSSLRVCKVLAKGESPTADEMSDSVQALQFMLDAWGADNLMTWGQTQESFPLVANQRTYSIGVGGNFNTVYPYKILDAFVRDGNSVDTGIDVLTHTEYWSYSDKKISTARPEALNYYRQTGNQAVPTGTIDLYPIPDASTPYTLFLNCQKALLAIINSTQTFTLLAPYEEAIKYNLAIRLWDEYHEGSEPIPQHIHQLAREAKKTIERQTFEFEISETSLPGSRSGLWNLLTDTPNR